MGFDIGKTVAGYEILEILGSDKTGVAYKVRNVFAQRFEVLKVLPKDVGGNEEQVIRFLREIKVHARLVHANIVTFYNAREIEGQLVMTTEYVPGMTVEERLEAGPIAWREASGYACQALSALEYAHANGVIHRGLSSSCLVITSEGIARLGGFGMAKVVSDPQFTAVGTVVGALRYISPEQVKGVALDARCDIYSLGVVLYEMLTGRLPFDFKGEFELMLAHVNTPPTHPSEVKAEVPRELGDLVLKTLAKEPGQRFQSAQEFRAALEAALGNQGAAADVAAHSLEPLVTEMEPPRQQPVAAAFNSPVAIAPAVADSTAGFGNSLFLKLAISLAAAAVTFLVGTAAVFAYMEMASH